MLSREGDPAGACDQCSSFACTLCGARVPKRSRYLCVLCFPSLVLLPSGGLPPGGPDPPPGGTPVGGPSPDAPSGGPAATARASLFEGTQEFEVLMPYLAESSGRERDFFHEGGVDEAFRAATDYGFEETRRHEIDKIVGYERYSDEVEAARRRDALRGAQLLSRQVSAAEASGDLHKDLVADAFGVAHWSIAVAIGEQPSPDRLALLADERLRFVIGTGMPARAAIA